MSTRKYWLSYFWRKLFKLFSFYAYCLFFMTAFLRIFPVSRDGPDLGIFGGSTQKGEMWWKHPRRKL